MGAPSKGQLLRRCPRYPWDRFCFTWLRTRNDLPLLALAFEPATYFSLRLALQGVLGCGIFSGLVGVRGCVGEIFCVGRAAHLALPSTEWTAYALPSGPRSPCVRSVRVRRRRMAHGSMTALVSSVIAGLRREETGQATIFSKRDLSHFLKGSFRCGSTRRFLPSVCQ